MTLFARESAVPLDRLVASEHVYNLTKIGLNIHSDIICDISRKLGPADHRFSPRGNGPMETALVMF